MTAVWIAGAVLLVLGALMLVTVRVDASYKNGVFSLTGRAGPVPVTIFPRERATARQVERKSRRDVRSLFRRLPLPLLRVLAESGCRALGRLIPRARVRLLCLHYRAAGPDPARAAMAYARAGLAMEGIGHLVGNADLRAEADLGGGPSSLEGAVSIGARLGAVLWAGACFGTDLLRGYFRYRRRAKTEG